MVHSHATSLLQTLHLSAPGLWRASRVSTGLHFPVRVTHKNSWCDMNSAHTDEKCTFHPQKEVSICRFLCFEKKTHVGKYTYHPHKNCRSAEACMGEVGSCPSGHKTAEFGTVK